MKRKIKLGLLGNGIGRSSSKLLHELIGEVYNLDASYELMDLANKDNVKIEDELKRCKNEGFDGVNVTHPYKCEAFKCVDVLPSFPNGLTSVNTVLLKNKELKADNTDYIGFCDAYTQQFGKNSKPGRVLMLGTGGVGLAIGHGLYKLGVSELIVYDKNEELAYKLVEVLKKSGLNAKVMQDSLENEMKKVDGLINATPIGMFQYPGNPFPEEGFANQKWAFDAVYTPVNTEFLNRCKKNGITTISGFKLFLYQGLAAFKKFSDLEIDSQKIEKIYLERYPLTDVKL